MIYEITIKSSDFVLSARKDTTGIEVFVTPLKKTKDSLKRLSQELKEEHKIIENIGSMMKTALLNKVEISE